MYNLYHLQPYCMTHVPAILGREVRPSNMNPNQLQICTIPNNQAPPTLLYWLTEGYKTWGRFSAGCYRLHVSSTVENPLQVLSEKNTKKHVLVQCSNHFYFFIK